MIKNKILFFFLFFIASLSNVNAISYNFEPSNLIFRTNIHGMNGNNNHINGITFNINSGSLSVDPDSNTASLNMGFIINNNIRNVNTGELIFAAGTTGNFSGSLSGK